MMDANHTPVHEYVRQDVQRPQIECNLTQEQINQERSGLWNRIMSGVNTIMSAGAETAHAMRSTDVINFYYRAAQAVNDPNMPQLLRVAPFDQLNGEISTKSSEAPISYDGGQLLNLYQDPMYRDTLEKIVKKYGYDPYKVRYFIQSRKRVEAFYVYFDGFIVVPDAGEKKIYVWYINKRMARELTSPGTYD